MFLYVGQYMATSGRNTTHHSSLTAIQLFESESLERGQCSAPVRLVMERNWYVGLHWAVASMSRLQENISINCSVSLYTLSMNFLRWAHCTQLASTCTTEQTQQCPKPDSARCLTYESGCSNRSRLSHPMKCILTSTQILLQSITSVLNIFQQGKYLTKYIVAFVTLVQTSEIRYTLIPYPARELDWWRSVRENGVARTSHRNKRVT
jgi:hypothetical protein